MINDCWNCASSMHTHTKVFAYVRHENVCGVEAQLFAEVQRMEQIKPNSYDRMLVSNEHNTDKIFYDPTERRLEVEIYGGKDTKKKGKCFYIGVDHRSVLLSPHTLGKQQGFCIFITSTLLQQTFGC